MPSAAGPIIGGIASGLAGAALSGGRSVSGPLRSAPVPQFDFGGLVGRRRGRDRLTIAPTSDRLAAVGGVQSVLGRGASEFRGLRERLRPGFGELTRARVASLGDVRRRTIGTLQQNIAQRRIAGSSFAADAIARAEAEFARQEDIIRAESFLQELEATTELLGRELQLDTAAIERGISELDFQTEVGTQLLSGVTTQLGANARLQSALIAEGLAGTGRFFQPAIEAIGTEVTGFINRLLE